jgi:hypothetical protein
MACIACSGLESYSKKVQETAASLLTSCFGSFSFVLRYCLLEVLCCSTHTRFARNKPETKHAFADEVANRFLCEAVALGLIGWDDKHAVGQLMKDAGLTFIEHEGGHTEKSEYNLARVLFCVRACMHACMQYSACSCLLVG